MKTEIAGLTMAGLFGALLALFTPVATAAHDEIIAQGLADYAEAFPDLYFLHLRGAKDIRALRALPQFLGEGASNLDYEHGPEARELLIETQVGRIAAMLRWGMPSATLFRTGNDSYARKPYVCVVTLDAERLSSDPLAATAFMLGEDREVSVDRVAERARLDNAAFIRFTLDHEIYHCHDTYLHGPTHPQTVNEELARYYDFRAEYRADLFAGLAARRATQNGEAFLSALMAFRWLALADRDWSHLTAPAVRNALDASMSEIMSLTLAALAREASNRAERTLPTPDEYRGLIAAAARVAPVTMGDHDAAGFTEGRMPARPIDQSRIAEIARELISAHRTIFGQDG